jgi:hypothetical protein
MAWPLRTCRGGSHLEMERGSHCGRDGLDSLAQAWDALLHRLPVWGMSCGKRRWPVRVGSVPPSSQILIATIRCLPSVSASTCSGLMSISICSISGADVSTSRDSFTADTRPTGSTSSASKALEPPALGSSRPGFCLSANRGSVVDRRLGCPQARTIGTKVGSCPNHAGR